MLAHDRQPLACSPEARIFHESVELPPRDHLADGRVPVALTPEQTKATMSLEPVDENVIVRPLSLI